jgi:hypothetical protein
MGNDNQTAPETGETLLNSTMRERMFAKVDDIGFAIAMGRDGMSVAGHAVYNLFLSEPKTDIAVVGEFYDRIQSAVMLAAQNNGKVVKEQKASSRGAQVNKFANYALVAMIANPNAQAAYEFARVESNLGYNKLVGCIVAIKREVAKNRDASETTLFQAVRDALTKVPPPLSEVVEELSDTWNTLRHGDEKKGHPYEAAFKRLVDTYPADYAEHVARALAVMLECAKAIENDAARAAAARKLSALSS